MPQGHRWVLWVAKPKVFPLWPLTEKSLPVASQVALSGFWRILQDKTLCLCISTIPKAHHPENHFRGEACRLICGCLSPIVLYSRFSNYSLTHAFKKKKSSISAFWASDVALAENTEDLVAVLKRRNLMGFPAWIILCTAGPVHTAAQLPSGSSKRSSC